jgi:hypothetical protein
MVSEVAGDVTVPEIAVMLIGPPAFTNVTKPFEPAVLLTVATVVSDDIQVTALVTSSIPPPEKVPIAVNCFEPVPKENDTLPAGLSAMDCRPERATVTLVEPLTVPDCAVIVAVPAATPDTRPVLLFTVAIVGSDDDQLAATADVLPSLKVPVADICTVHTEPAGAGHAAIVGVSGLTVIWVNVGLMKNPLHPASSSNATVARVIPTAPLPIPRPPTENRTKAHVT